MAMKQYPQRARTGMSTMRDASAQETGGHVSFGGSKSPALYVLCRVKLNVQLLAAFDGRACLHRKVAGAAKAG